MKKLTWVKIRKPLLYDGRQLCPSWVRSYSRASHVILTFTGPCDVSRRFMVDLEDLKDRKSIRSDFMSHIILKHAGFPLPFSVLCQRILIGIALCELEKLSGKRLLRSGDDLFFGKGKLSISVATQSKDRSSGLVHAAFNMTTQGTPSDVQTASLEDLGVDPSVFVNKTASSYIAEWESLMLASKKVKSV